MWKKKTSPNGSEKQKKISANNDTQTYPAESLNTQGCHEENSETTED